MVWRSQTKLRRKNSMIAPIKSSVTLAQPNSPVIETDRLKLRPWHGEVDPFGRTTGTDFLIGNATVPIS
jgi:hypothetical protein